MTSKFAIICKACGGNGIVIIVQRTMADDNILRRYIHTVECEKCLEVEYL